MKRLIVSPLIIATIFSMVACGHKEKKAGIPPSVKPVVTNNGATIDFPLDSVTLGFFKTEAISTGNMDAILSAPARVVATVLRSKENQGHNMVLFDNADLTAEYTALLQHVINIRQKESIIKQKNAIASQKEIEVNRFSDLASHGAGTGKDVADARIDLITAQTDRSVAETELSNEKSTIIEHEARLKLAGFDPQSLLQAQPDKVWLICDVPENLVSTIKEGNTCKLQFTAYPDETFNGTIEDVGEVIDNITRMVKLRIGLPNKGNKLRAGMFATVHFGISEGNNLSIPKASMVTVQGKNYVFVRSAYKTFERKEVVSGVQINDRILIYSGLKEHDTVVTEGAMQLKGISFGY